MSMDLKRRGIEAQSDLKIGSGFSGNAAPLGREVIA